MENHIASFCPNCGAKLVESQKFCPNCGTCVAQEFAEQNLTGQESPERAPQPINHLPLKQPSSFKEEIKNKKKKKKLAKIIVPIVVVIVLIVASLGIFSFVNYNNFLPYKEMLGKLENGDFIYYREYDGLSRFDFTESVPELTFFEKLLNLRDVCEVRLTPHIYYLYDKDSVEENDDLYDLIAEEEDEEIYNEMPKYCELVIDENGDSKIVSDNKTIFNINLDTEKNIVSVIYNEYNTEYINDTELNDKYKNLVGEYEDYLARNESAKDLLYIAEFAPLYYGDSSLDTTIADYVFDRVNNPQITISANRSMNNVYRVTVTGDFLYNSDFSQNAVVLFGYDSDRNISYVTEDPQEAFLWYIYDEFPSYAYYPMW